MIRTVSPRLTSARGFTLAELAIVLVIVGLLLGGLLVPLSAQRDTQSQRDTEKALATAIDALLGFAAANGRLPCPATTASNGLESPVGGGDCTSFYNGFLPAATLGLSPVDQNGLMIDAWNQPIRYTIYSGTINGVSNPFTSSNGIKNATMTSISATTTTLLSVCTTATDITTTDCGTTASKLSDKAPAVIFSIGRNGVSGGTGIDEAANLDNDPVFVSHTPTPTGATNGEFDDMVTWLSSNVLFNRMIAAGQLP